MSTSQILGSRVSVITRTNIRYEGVIQSIDQVTRSLTLQDVRIHGTENRQPPSGQVVPPSAEVFDSIEFNSGDLSHLEIIEAVPQAPVNTFPASVPTTPAATQPNPVADPPLPKPTEPMVQQPPMMPNPQAPMPGYGMPYGNPMAYGYGPMGYPGPMQEVMQNHYFQSYLQYLHRQKATPGGYPYPPMNPFQNPAFENYMAMYSQQPSMNLNEYDTANTTEAKPPAATSAAPAFNMPVPAPPPSLSQPEIPTSAIPTSGNQPSASPFSNPFSNPFSKVEESLSALSIAETTSRTIEPTQVPSLSTSTVLQTAPIATPAALLTASSKVTAESNAPTQKPAVQPTVEEKPEPSPAPITAWNKPTASVITTNAAQSATETSTKAEPLQKEAPRASNRSVFDPPNKQQRNYSSFAGRSDRRHEGGSHHHYHNHHGHRSGSSNYNSSGYNSLPVARESTPLGDFDYVESTASFDKEKFFEDIKAKDEESSFTVSTAPSTNVYQKSSFFDNLSGSQNRPDENRNRFDQRRMDVETFGQQNYSHRGGYRGGRGGYGGYNRGRGGYSHGGGRSSTQTGSSEGFGGSSQQQQYGSSSGQRQNGLVPRGRANDQGFRGGHRRFTTD